MIAASARLEDAMADTDFARLVGPERVHRSVYTDPTIFEFEMERVFKRAWLYVGHESQIPQPGDFMTLTLARQPVVLVRHRDGTPQVLFNRCGHRGALVCNEPCGNVSLFRCCYHGWTFKTNGEVHAIPLKGGYPANFDAADPKLGMVRLPRVASHRGFVFVSFAADGPDLATHMGPMLARIDDLADRSPVGQVIVASNAHKYRIQANWKEQIENLNDLYHPPFSHESTTNPQGRQFSRQGDEGGVQLSASGNPISFWDETGVWAADRGHSYCGRISNAGINDPASRELFEILRARDGEARAMELMNPFWHNAIIYPNVNIQSMSQHVRIIVPLAVDLTEIHVYPILLKDAPLAYNQAVIRYLNITHAPASLIQTDDLEAFNRIQRGLATDGSDWVVLSRHFGGDVEEKPGLWRGQGTSELPMRNQYRAWVGYMSGEADHAAQ